MMATEEELDALVNRAERLLSSAKHMNEVDGVEVVSPGIVPDLLTAITTLRAQLAEAQRLMRLERTIADKNADRAERAEAALAAQIEVDAGIATAETAMPSQYNSKDQWRASIGQEVAAAIRNQPRAGAAEHGSYDRTTLDRMLAEAREKALREAAEILDDEGWLGMSLHRIRALIKKEKTE